MQITDTRVRLLEASDKLRAVASVTFDDCFVVHDIKVIEGSNGTFVAMPSRKMGDDDFRDIAHPINQETRDMVRDAVLRKYDEALRERMQLSDEEAEKIAARFF